MKGKTEKSATSEDEKSAEGRVGVAAKIKTPKPEKRSEDSARTPGRLEPLKLLVRSKKFYIPAAAVILLLVVLFVLPFTRYKVLGLFMKRDVRVTVHDTATQRVVSGALVRIDGISSTTDKDGMAELKKVHLGEHKVTITKMHYKDFTGKALVTMQKDRTADFKVEATGRQVPIVIKNKVGNTPLADVLVRAGDADARTDKDGKAIIVVPAGANEISTKLSLGGFNEITVTLKVTEVDIPENSFALTPVGKVHFLSKQSGKIDVVKTNLDGSDRQVVVAGTGKEEDYGTVLLASRDWKYLALLSRRDGDKAKLYLIETESGKLMAMDEGDVRFDPYGWSGHSFVYVVNREKQKLSQPNRQALKSFNADTRQLATLDQTKGEDPGGWGYDYRFEYINNVTVFEDIIVFSKGWSSSGFWNWWVGQNYSIMSVAPDGKNLKTLRQLPVQNHNLDRRLYAPREIIFNYNDYTTNASEFFEFEDNAVEPAKDITREEFERAYPTYLLSPSAQYTLWTDSRDGKTVVFVGNKDGKDEKTVAAFSEFTPYGWYSDEYVLVTKKGSELYVMPRSGAKDEHGLLKISDYHKPDRSFAGYGGGYGGL